MAKSEKYFLGSVGKAEAFRRAEDGSLELAFVSKTLTDSGLNISTTKDDVRAGTGAPIQFSFYHDPSVEITLTDVLWKKEYLEAQLGARFKSDAKEDYYTDKITFDANKKGTPNREVKAVPVPSCDAEDGEVYLVWAAPVGTDDWKEATYDKSQNEITLSEGSAGEYCVRYLAYESRAEQAEITSMIIPEELFLVITAPIFAGNSCAASKGQLAGHITFEVPRFQLNGAQEFAMNMSSNQTMSLAGTALASESLDCEAMGGKLLRIIEVINNRDWKADIAGILVDGESEVVNKEPVLYAEMKDGSLQRLTASDGVQYKVGEGEYQDLLANTKFTVGVWKFKIAGTNIESETVTIAAAE